MPLYVSAMGGTSFQIGLIIGLFSFMAMVLRPPTGWFIDTRGCRVVLLAGMAIFMLASLGYVIAHSVTMVLALRLFHGMGMGLFPTAATVVVAEVAPPARRGEAMGWFGIANSVGLIIGPTVGTPIATGAGFPTLFLVAGGMALMGLLCIWLLPRIGRMPAKTAGPAPAGLFQPGRRPPLGPAPVPLCALRGDGRVHPDHCHRSWAGESGHVLHCLTPWLCSWSGPRPVTYPIGAVGPPSSFRGCY